MEEFWIAPTPSEPFEKPPENARQVVTGKGRKVALTLRRDEVDLGVQVFLHKFRRKLEPGASQAAHYSSLIDLLDRDDASRALRSNVLVTLNAPLDFTDPATGRSYRLFQSNFAGPLEAEKLDIPWTGPADPPPRLYLSVLTVNHDPGRGWKYLGCLLIVGGIFYNYFLKSFFRNGAVSAILVFALLNGGPTARAEDAGGWIGARGGGCRCWTAAASCPWTPSPAAQSRKSPAAGPRGSCPAAPPPKCC